MKDDDLEVQNVDAGYAPTQQFDTRTVYAQKQSENRRKDLARNNGWHWGFWVCLFLPPLYFLIFIWAIVEFTRHNEEDIARGRGRVSGMFTAFFVQLILAIFVGVCFGVFAVYASRQAEQEQIAEEKRLEAEKVAAQAKAKQEYLERKEQERRDKIATKQAEIEAKRVQNAARLAEAERKKQEIASLKEMRKQEYELKKQLLKDEKEAKKQIIIENNKQRELDKEFLAFIQSENDIKVLLERYNAAKAIYQRAHNQFNAMTGKATALQNQLDGDKKNMEDANRRGSDYAQRHNRVMFDQNQTGGCYDVRSDTKDLALREMQKYRAAANSYKKKRDQMNATASDIRNIGRSMKFAIRQMELLRTKLERLGVDPDKNDNVVVIPKKNLAVTQLKLAKSYLNNSKNNPKVKKIAIEKLKLIIDEHPDSKEANEAKQLLEALNAHKPGGS